MSTEMTEDNPGKQLNILDATTLPHLDDGAYLFRRHSIQPEKTERQSVVTIRRLNTVDYSRFQDSDGPFYKNIGDGIISEEHTDGKMKSYRNLLSFIIELIRSINIYI